jgi:hypothetical protein
VDNALMYAGVATVQNGHPVILWNAHSNGRLSQTEQIFIYLHECAHHTLGHLSHSAVDAGDEREADCWAIQLMVDGGMIKGRQLEMLERSRRTVRGDDTHLAGEAHVRSLEECLSIRTDAKAWAAALDTAVIAAQDSFIAYRGRLLDSTSTPPVFEALLDVPGTYDCEVVGGALRCMVFAARKDGAAKKRYQQLVKILRSWLPSGWTFAERVGEAGKTRTFQAQDALTGQPDHMGAHGYSGVPARRANTRVAKPSGLRTWNACSGTGPQVLANPADDPGGMRSSARAQPSSRMLWSRKCISAGLIAGG